MAAASPYSKSDADLMYARRLFALSRMVEVLLYNLARLHDFWPLLLDHVVELLSDSRAPARTGGHGRPQPGPHWCPGRLRLLQMNAQVCR